MVKSETLFCRLVSIDTLIAFDGIIPCAADFQLRLTSLIEQFNKALQAENQSATESEALCRALCCYFDERLIDEALSWQRYSLVNYFYGYSETEQARALPNQLDALLSSESEMIFRYAWKLLTMLIQFEEQPETLASLRAAGRTRYFSRARPALNAVTPLPAASGSSQLMVFIIGPFASKWFSQSDLSSTSGNSIIWVIAEHADAMASRLEYMEKNHPEIATLAFLPLLADGFENSGIMIEQITAWQYTFSPAHLPRHLPCMLGLYTRLSQQRFPYDPERAIWTGGPEALAKIHLNLEARLVNLIDELDARDDGSDIFAIQRHALGSTLVAWLAEQRIMAVMQSLFDNTQLDLAGVTLADHGQGFTRHGAWSRWLGEKYGILPGLSASVAMPPLPTIPLPPAIEPEPAPYLQTVAVITPSPARRRRWPLVAALLVLLACLSGGLYFCGQQYIDRFLSWLAPLHDSKAEDNAAQFTLSGTMPLFENGSSSLIPESEKALAELVPKMLRRPQQRYLIIGHSDNTGSAATNLTLSTERARVIRDWLTEHTGLPASHFMVEGAGNTRPVTSNDTRQGRAQNRRVEIIPLSLQGHED